MWRLGYSCTADNTVTSSPADTEEDAIDEAERLLRSGYASEAWVRNPNFEIVWGPYKWEGGQ